jgi:hypothetical protein
MKKDRFGSASFRLKAGLRTFRFWRWLIRFIGVIGAATVPWRLCAFTRNGLSYSGGGSRQGAKTQRPPRRNAHYYGAI